MQGVTSDFVLWAGDVVWLCAKTMTQDYTGATYDERATALIYYSGHAGVIRQ